MKQYEYVTVEARAAILSYNIEKHRRIIDEYAKKGFRYVGYIPVQSSSQGIVKIDLIFEQDV